jgi:IS66 C-terminal element
MRVARPECDALFVHIVDASDSGSRHPARYGQNGREIALGRKAWHFAGSDRGGHRAAVMLTLIETAKLNCVDPQAWLAEVLTRIADQKNHGAGCATAMELAEREANRECCLIDLAMRVVPAPSSCPLGPDRMLTHDRCATSLSRRRSQRAGCPEIAVTFARFRPCYCPLKVTASVESL